MSTKLGDLRRDLERMVNVELKSDWDAIMKGIDKYIRE